MTAIPEQLQPKTSVKANLSPFKASKINKQKKWGVEWNLFYFVHAELGNYAFLWDKRRMCNHLVQFYFGPDSEFVEWYVV